MTLLGPSLRTGCLACFGVGALLACRAEPNRATVEIVEPADGATVRGPEVRVLLAARGTEIAPAAEERPGTAHHHLFIDRPMTPASDTIPAGIPGIIHLGRGQTEFTVTALAPGQHTLIALLANWAHLPLQPLATDTVQFTIEP